MKGKLDVLFLVAVVMCLFGCDKGDEQIKVYRVAKAPLESPVSEKAPMPTNASSPANPVGPVPTAPPSVTAPPGWEPQPPSQMRQASFLVHDDKGAVADISLVTLGGAAGNVLENVNRWLSQLGQPAITAEKLAGIVQHLATSRGDVIVVDLAGVPENGDATKDGRIIAAMVSGEGKTSFFKIRGNSELVGAQKENFLKWVSAVCGTVPASSAAESMSPPPSSDAPRIKWELPKGWVAGAASAMRYASFTASGENNQTADISIVTFPGDGGSDAENINRWRQQISLPPVEATAAAGLIVPAKGRGGSFSTVDMTNDTARVVAGWIRRDGRTWFFKLTGPQPAVENEKPRFLKFLESVEF